MEAPAATDYTNPVVDVLTGEDPLVEWLVPNLIPRGSLIQFAGEPGAGKSLFSYALAMAIATGSDVLGFKPERPVPVLYCDVENSTPDRNQYLRWVWYGLGQPSLDLVNAHFWTSHFELGTEQWAKVLETKIQEHKPEFMVIDTATPAFDIQDENNNAEATDVINKLRAFQRLPGRPAMLILRHAKTFTESDVDGKPIRKARGAQTWKGSTDATWFHVRSEGRPKKNGLKTTRIEPDKIRAFGLRSSVNIDPEWVCEGQGLRLNPA